MRAVNSGLQSSKTMIYLSWGGMFPWNPLTQICLLQGIVCRFFGYIDCLPEIGTSWNPSLVFFNGLMLSYILLFFPALTTETIKKYSVKDSSFNYSWAPEGAVIICFTSGKLLSFLYVFFSELSTRRWVNCHCQMGINNWFS